MCGMILSTATISLNCDSSEHNLLWVKNCNFRYHIDTFYAYNGWNYLTLSWFTLGDYFVVYFMTFNHNFSHSSHGCVSVVLYLLFILYYSVHRQRNMPCLIRSEKTATIATKGSSCNVVPDRRNNYRGSWICRYSYALVPIPVKFHSEIFSVISIIFLLKQ
jgi:hypothetical protein